MKKSSIVVQGQTLCLLVFMLLSLCLVPAAFAQTVTITATPQEAANVSPGYRSRVLYMFQVDVTGNTATLNGISGLTTSGNYLTSDVAVNGTSSGFRVQYFSQQGSTGIPSFRNSISNLENVAGGKTLATVLPASTGSGQTLNASFNAPLVLPIGRHWLFITVDLAPGAAIGNTLGLNSFTRMSFNFTGSTTVNPGSFPATGLQTFRNATLRFSAFTPVPAFVERGFNLLVVYRVDITATGAATQLVGGGAGRRPITFNLNGSVLGTAATNFGNFRIHSSRDNVLDQTDQTVGDAIPTAARIEATDSLPFGIREGSTRSIFLSTNVQAGGQVGTTVQVTSVEANVPAGTSFVAGAAPSDLPGGGLQTIGTNVAQVRLEGSRTSATQLLQGTNNNVLGSIKVSVTGATTALSRIGFQVPGTYIPVTYSAFKLWGSNSNVFNPATAALLNTWPRGYMPRNGPIEFSFPGVGQIASSISYWPAFLAGTTRYFYLTVDIEPDAPVGATVGFTFGTANATSTVIPGVRTVVVTTNAALPVVAVNPQIQLSAPLPSATNLPRGVDDQRLYQLNLAVSNADAQLTGLRLSVATSNFADITGGYRLYYSTSSTLNVSAATLVGNVAATANQQLLSFTPVNPILIPARTRGYLFVVATTHPDAVLGNTVTVSPPSLTDITFQSGVASGTLTGVTHTLSALPQIALSTPALPNEKIAPGTKNVVVYQLNMATSVADANFIGLAFRMARHVKAEDVTNYRLFFSTDNKFDLLTDQLVGTAIASADQGETLEINSFSPIQLPQGSGRSVFVVVDISPDAQPGSQIQVQAIGPYQVNIPVGEYTGTPRMGALKTVAAPPAIAVRSGVPTSLNTPAGTADVVFYRADLAVNGVYANLTGVSFATIATFRANDVSGGFKLYYSTSQNFDPASATPVGKVAPAVIAPNRLEFLPSAPIRINAGTTGYLFLVASISPYAKAGSQIGVEALQLNDVSFESAVKNSSARPGNLITVTQALAKSYPYRNVGNLRLPCPNGTAPDLVLNITQPPFNADPTGQVDATAAFNRALSQSRSFVYVPNGTYRLTDSLTWNPTVPSGSRGRGGANIVLWGESREGVTLKLDDNARGFSNPGRPKTLIFTGEDSPDRFNNSLHNLTINTGSGNPAAIGLRHYCNNYGGVYNLAIKSGDGQGLIGLDKGYSRANGPNLTKDVLVDGFNIGIRTDFAIESLVFEHITLRNQKVAGFYNLRQVLSIRDLRVENCTGPALVNESGHVVLLDGDLSGTGNAAIRNDATAKLLVRNLVTSGYGQAIADPQLPVPAKRVNEWTSDAPVSLFDTPTRTTLRLPVNETPQVPWEAPANWVNVEDFGATSGGVCSTPNPPACTPCDDDAPAIQRAIDATLPGGSREGAKTLYIPGNYRLMSTLRIRGSINRIVGAATGMGAPGNGLDVNGAQIPVMIVVEDGTSPVIVFENFTTGNSTTEGCMDGCLGLVSFENSSGRTLVFRNTSLGSCVFNGGEVYFESVTGTRDGRWTFNNARTWARQIDPERDDSKVIVNGGTFWALGLKTEGHGEIIIARNDAKVEVFGAWIYSLSDSRNFPMFVIEDAEAAINFYEYNAQWGAPYQDIVKETQNGQTLTLGRGSVSPPSYPAPQPVTPPTYPANWSGRNDGTGAVIDNVVGSNLVLFLSARGNTLNLAPQFTLSSTTVESSEIAGSETVRNFATGINDGNPELDQQLWFEVSTDNPSLFEVLPAIDAITGTLTYQPKFGIIGKATVTVVLKDDGAAQAPNQNSSAPQTFVIDILETYVVREYWAHIAGTSVSNIPVTTTPTSTSRLTSLEDPTPSSYDVEYNNFGQRIRGYIVPTVTATYYFYIASDNNGEFWLSIDDQPANKGMAPIANLKGSTRPREWTKDLAHQKSAGMALVAGRKYYFEALMKESGGNNNLAIGWTTATDNTGITVIGRTNIAPYVCTNCRDSAEAPDKTQKADFNLNLRPNPASSEVTISLAGFQQETAVQVKMTDMTGRIFALEQIQLNTRDNVEAVTLPISHLPQGLFFVTVQGNKTVRTAKLVITK